MKLISGIQEMQLESRSTRSEGRTIAVVPTMGFLHAGHASLISMARRKADVVITTIFVNPTQFGPGEDYQRYPRDLERDYNVAESHGTDILFTPDAPSMYPEPYRTFVDVDSVTQMLEGASRPGHFRGVATVVAKLFHITDPHFAFFGQKDAQQVVVIRQMVRDLNFDVEIVVGPIVREEDGLALSSRNTYLSPTERDHSTILHQALKLAEDMIAGGERNSARIIAAMKSLIDDQSSARIDYLSIAHPDTLREISDLNEHHEIRILVAAWFGVTRLIDNTTVEVRGGNSR